MEEPGKTRTYNLVEARPVALVVHCSDPRFQRAFTQFIRDELKLQEGEYVPLVVSGGVASLSEPFRLPKEFKFMKERIKFFLERFDTVNRIVLINHEDCRHYEALRSSLGAIFLQHVQHMTERQIKDLKAVSKLLLDFLAPGIGLELYYAKMTGGFPQSVVFERIPLT